MKDDNLYLTHILECIENIETYIPNGKEDFFRSKLVQDAVIRNLEIIGGGSNAYFRRLSKPTHSCSLARDERNPKRINS
ncbi:HepT-like ribonuclease domain-containing protein [Salibacterium qingdaonense]|uniref:Uncharacterized protein n=1 Tax=Salibacterium qingdaonense TaxID=266892 RepID=A0A1I4MC70_9BACI|nr:hypothetical protein SAMN04488054_11123 [Salibacterium qingdaonense]